MSMLRTLISLAAAATLINAATAISYTVGGPTGGWDTATNVQAWASSQTFLVGDSLIFQTTPFHNVLEVSKSDYDSCQNSNPIQIQSGGTTPVPLISPGSRYFICGRIGHCSLGMKVEIVTLAASAAPPVPPPNIPTPAADTPLTSSSPIGLPEFPPASSEPTDIPTPQPTGSQDFTSSPSITPTESSVRSVFPQEAPLSSAAKVKFVGGSVMGLAYVMMVLMFL